MYKSNAEPICMPTPSTQGHSGCFPEIRFHLFYKLQWSEIISLKIKSTIVEVCKNVIYIMLFAIVTEIWMPKERMHHNQYC